MVLVDARVDAPSQMAAAQLVEVATFVNQHVAGTQAVARQVVGGNINRCHFIEVEIAVLNVGHRR